MKLHSIINSSTVNGPGDRMVVWTQGCALNCEGCWNPETHSFDAGTFITEEELANQIIRKAKDGVTWSGGDPMHQCHEVFKVMRLVKEVRSELSFGMYTGYSLKELENGHFDVVVGGSLHRFSRGSSESHRNTLKSTWSKCQIFLDFAVMGRYNKQQACNEPLRSSKNQELRLFTQRYTEDMFESQSFELDISSDLIQITGFPPIEMLRA